MHSTRRHEIPSWHHVTMFRDKVKNASNVDPSLPCNLPRRRFFYSRHAVFPNEAGTRDEPARTST